MKQPPQFWSVKYEDVLGRTSEYQETSWENARTRVQYINSQGYSARVSVGLCPGDVVYPPNGKPHALPGGEYDLEPSAVWHYGITVESHARSHEKLMQVARERTEHLLSYIGCPTKLDARSEDDSIIATLLNALLKIVPKP